MRKNDTKGYKVFTAFNVLFMIVIMAITLYPLIYVLFASFSDSDLFIATKVFLIKPVGFSLESYKMVFRDPMILRGYGNTLLLVVVGVSLNMVLTILGAYVLSRRNAKFIRPMTLMILFTMYFNGGLIPFYFVVKSLGMVNSFWVLVIPTAINTYNLIIMRSAFAAVPKELEEAAAIDGANHFVILVRVLVPVVIPTIMVIILYYTVGRWNEWFYASIFLNDRSKFPLQLVLREILVQNDTSKMTAGAEVADTVTLAETVKYAVMIVSTVPILLIYPFLQKYFVKGVMIGAVKG